MHGKNDKRHSFHIKNIREKFYKILKGEKMEVSSGYMTKTDTPN